MATYKSALKNKESIDEDAELEADRLAWEAVKKKYQHASHEWFPEGKA
jgi:cation transport regulator ChaB